MAEQYQLRQRKGIGKLQIEELGANYGGVLVDVQYRVRRQFSPNRVGNNICRMDETPALGYEHVKMVC